jgi:hypothetical protein
MQLRFHNGRMNFHMGVVNVGNFSIAHLGGNAAEIFGNRKATIGCPTKDTYNRPDWCRGEDKTYARGLSHRHNTRKLRAEQMKTKSALQTCALSIASTILNNPALICCSGLGLSWCSLSRASPHVHEKAVSATPYPTARTLSHN